MKTNSVKRVGAYVVSKIIYYIPVYILCSIFTSDCDLGFYLDSIFEITSVLYYFIYSEFMGLIILNPASFVFMLLIWQFFISIIVSNIIVEFLFSLIFKVDIGSKILGFKLVDKVKNHVSIWKILLRATIKYLSIGLCLPILLFPLLNKKGLFLHEMISGVYKCDKRDVIPSKN